MLYTDATKTVMDRYSKSEKLLNKYNALIVGWYEAFTILVVRQSLVSWFPHVWHTILNLRLTTMVSSYN